MRRTKLEPVSDGVLLLDHSAELGGGELSLLDYARSTCTPVCVIVYEPGPLTDLLRRYGISVEVLEAGRLLGVRRGNGLIAALSILPGLARFVSGLARRMRAAPISYANSQKALVTACLANIVARRPLIWHLHDIMTAAHFSGTMRRIAIGLSNRFASRVIANSAATEHSYRTAGGTLPVTVVHNGIDPVPFDDIDSKAARSALCDEAEIPSDATIIALFGRLSPWKGQEIAIEAIRDLSNTHLVLVGAALFGDASFEVALRKRVHDLGVADRVHFVGFRDDVATLLAAVDIVVHCSTAPEPFGRVIVEAMLAGTPVIATAGGGALEIVENGRTGILVPPGDGRMLADAVNMLIDDPVLAEWMAKAARIEALDRFSLAATVERIDAVIAATVNVGPGGYRAQ